MGRSVRQRVSLVIAVVCLTIAAVVLTAIAWLLVRDPDLYDDDDAGAPPDRVLMG